MKKGILVGAICLAIGMSSCKTYCPAYGYEKTETQKVENTTVVATSAEKATDRVSS